MARKRAELSADEGAEFFETNDQEVLPTPQATTVESDDPVVSYSVDLRASEWQRLEAIALEKGATRQEAATWALRSFLNQYEAGEVQMVKKPRYRGCKMLSDEVQLIFLSAYFKVFDKPK